MKFLKLASISILRHIRIVKFQKDHAECWRDRKVRITDKTRFSERNVVEGIKNRTLIWR